MFALSMPPTWQRGFEASSVLSLHLMY